MQHSLPNIFSNYPSSNQPAFDFAPRERRVTIAPTPAVPPFITKSAQIVYNDDQEMLTPFFTDPREFTFHGGEQLPLSDSYHPQQFPQQPQQEDAYAAHDARPLDSSPAWDTPRTLYKSSPLTDAGDMDAVDSDDEDVVVRRRSADNNDEEENKGQASNGIATDNSNPLGFALASTSPKSYTLGDLVDKEVRPVSESQVRLFTSRLQDDIKSASLFPWASSTPIAVVATPSTQLPPPPTQVHHSIPQSSADVIAPPVNPLSSHIPPVVSATIPPRQPSIHLRRPAQPINPYERPAMLPQPPLTPYRVPALDPSHFRFSQYRAAAPERTVNMRDLLVPNAQFHCGFDPEVLAAELTSPPNLPEDLDVLREEYDIDMEFAFPLVEDVMAAPLVVPSQPQQVQAAPIPQRQPTPVAAKTRAGTKRSAAAAEIDSEYEVDSDEDADGESDDEYQAPAYTRIVVAAGAQTEHPVKRARLSLTASTRDSASPAPSQAAPSSPTATSSRRAAQTAAQIKARTRHLQPNLVRNNGCLHGCPLTFSTAYEARRHQEDAHGREEAHNLIDLAAGATVYPRDFRFLIQIGLHGNSDKWDGRTKAAFQAAVRKEDNPLDATLATTLSKFAKEWSKRYECPRCGTSFSRLDSKKRHYEKQCR